jgi:glycerophosphoryl diester phosphodiesterase
MKRPPLRAVLAVAILAAAFPALPFDLQGHRGARGLAPENTLPAFATALTVGVDTLELDTGVTRDGVVVIIHDPRLNPDITRGPDGQWLREPGPFINASTYAELLRYDLGRLNTASNYGKRYPEQKAFDGTRIPKLADLFALVRKSGNTSVRFNIETKVDPRKPAETLPPEEFARALIREIRAAGMAGRASIQSFDWRTLKVVHAEAPEIPTVYLSAQQKWLDNISDGTWTAGQRIDALGSVPKMVHAAGGRIWSPYFGDIDAAKLTEARSLGLKVVVWTVNAPADISRMLDLAVDGIISDRPDLVRAEMQKRGMPLPAATPVSP